MKDAFVVFAYLALSVTARFSWAVHVVMKAKCYFG